MKEDKKCPVCGNGVMKHMINTVPLTSQVPRTTNEEMRVRCSECGYEDDFSKFYQPGSKQVA